MGSWFGGALRFGAALLRAAAASVRDNLTIALLAIGMAVALWVFVTDEENPAITVEVTPAVQVSAVNVPDGAAVLGLSTPVGVIASAPRDIALRLTASDFRATVSLDGLGLGTHDVPVRVEHVGGGRDVRVVQVSPGVVSLTLQPVRSAVVPVRVEVGTRPPAGYEAGDLIRVEPATVSVSGAEDLVLRVAEVVARVDLVNVRNDLEANIALVATNGRDSAIEGVVIEPQRARVRVSIKQTLFERSFAIDPLISGQPAAGYTVGSIEISPPTVVVQGPLNKLDPLGALATEGINVSGAVTDVVQRANLVLPDGVRLKNIAQTVQVRIRIAAATGRATFGVSPAFAGLGDGLSARGLTPLVEIEVEGPLPQLRALGPTAFAAVADLAGLAVGRHDVAVKASAPAGVSVITVRPALVTVEISR